MNKSVTYKILRFLAYLILLGGVILAGVGIIGLLIMLKGGYTDLAKVQFRGFLIYGVIIALSSAFYFFFSEVLGHLSEMKEKLNEIKEQNDRVE